MSDFNSNGGPAFPTTERNMMTGHPDELMSGMTMRDYFAAKAMHVVWAEIPEDANREQALAHLGKSSYEMADAMLRAREAK